MSYTQAVLFFSITLIVLFINSDWFNDLFARLEEHFKMQSFFKRGQNSPLRIGLCIYSGDEGADVSFITNLVAGMLEEQCKGVTTVRCIAISELFDGSADDTAQLVHELTCSMILRQMGTNCLRRLVGELTQLDFIAFVRLTTRDSQAGPVTDWMIRYHNGNGIPIKPLGEQVRCGSASVLVKQTDPDSLLSGLLGDLLHMTIDLPLAVPAVYGRQVVAIGDPTVG